MALFKKKKDEAEAVAAPKKKASNPKFKKALTSFLGGLFVLFALIGFVSTSIGVVNFSKEIINKSSKKTKYENFLKPIIMLDPVHFTSSAKASQTFLIQASLWYIVFTNPTDSFAQDDMSNLIIPASDVDVAATALFGKNVSLVHQSVGDVSSMIIFDEGIKSYHLPIYGVSGVYTPLVAEIEKTGETVTLTVGYIPPGPLWGTDSDGNVYKTDPDKFAYYVLRENKDEMYLVSINDVPAEKQEELIAKYSKKKAE